MHDCAVRVLTTFEQRDPSQRPDVVWLAADEFRGNVRRTVRVAPLSVGGLLRSRLFGESTVVLTSATLTVGGSFDGLAVNWGLPPQSPARSDTTSASVPNLLPTRAISRGMGSTWGRPSITRRRASSTSPSI